MNFVKSTDILPGYRSDHSMVLTNFSFNDLDRGKGYWKFNNSLLKDIDYVNLVKCTIKNVIHQYVASPHNPDNIDNIPLHDINFVISYQLLFEMILLEIRGKTISYSSFKRKEGCQKEGQLISEIEQL